MVNRTKKQNRVVLLIGGNDGNRVELLKEACAQIESNIGHIETMSSVYETEPWGFSAEQNFLNKVLIVQTFQTAEEVLENCLLIENRLGRTRTNLPGYASRTMDIDVLYFNNEIYNLPHLQIPHPRIAERRFVLIPLNEIMPQFVDPVLEKPIEYLLQHCKDNSMVKLFEEV